MNAAPVVLPGPSPRVGHLVAVAALALALALVLGCRSSLPRPPIGSHPGASSQYVAVPYPPPPARIEIVPNQPDDRAVFVDGEWVWEANRWVWEPGGWLIPPEGARFAPWVTTRISDGRLFWLPGTWYDAKGDRVPRPKLLAAAASSLGAQEAPAPHIDAGPGP